jgi:transposase InsO family protein
VARCTTAWLMREMGLVDVIRGKPVKTMVSNRPAPCPLRWGPPPQPACRSRLQTTVSGAGQTPGS